MPPRRASRTDRIRDRFRLAQTLHQQGRLPEAGSIYQEIPRLDPRHADALHLLGLIALQTNQPTKGVELIERAIALRPDYPQALANLGIGYTDLGRHDDALASFDKALRLMPGLAEAHDSRGNALRALGQFEAAIASHDKALALRPDDAGALNNRGNALRNLLRYQDALASYDRAIALQPGFIEARCNQAGVLQAMGRFGEALTTLNEVIAAMPDHVEAHEARGHVLRDLKRSNDALASFVRAIGLNPASAGAHDGHGSALQDLGRHFEATASHATAIRLQPGFAPAHNNLGNALQKLQRFGDALASYATAIAMKPDYAEAYYNRGNTFAATYRMQAALADYEQSAALKSDRADVWRAHGVALAALRQDRKALVSLRKAQQLNPDMPWLLGDIAFSRRRICDWTSDKADIADLEARLLQFEPVASPFAVTAVSGSPAVQRRTAEIFSERLFPSSVQPGLIDPPASGSKIRLAYISADFRDHAMMHLMAGLFECHDRSRFELYAFSLGSETDDDCMRRVRPLFDGFINAGVLPDNAIAEQARSLGIDIAIDLMGFTTGNRTGIFIERAAPVQVNYLGYPGTMGSGAIDYIIADPIVIPLDAASHYAEKIVHLPGSYQVNDRRRPIDDCTPPRVEQGLPDSGFVFCCFNNNYKITPDCFAGWMRILAAIKGSVLWLFQDNADAVGNLRLAAAQHGIALERLIFADRLPVGQHLARHRLAGLFLDTLPYNAHTTASDALWSGLPVLTRIGDSFAGRVAASLLHAVGLPELVTTTQQEFEACAIALANCPDQLAAVRNKLRANRLSTPLFDTARYTSHLEAAYTVMQARAQAGLPPEPIGVEALQDR